jgi:hypothetical protein
LQESRIAGFDLHRRAVERHIGRAVAYAIVGEHDVAHVALRDIQALASEIDPGDERWNAARYCSSP